MNPRNAGWHSVEVVNGCTVIGPSESADPIHFGQPEAGGAYVAIIGVFQPGEPAPPFHIHPNTDEGFYIANGQATFRLGDREVTVTAGGFVFVPRGTLTLSGTQALTPYEAFS